MTGAIMTMVGAKGAPLAAFVPAGSYEHSVVDPADASCAITFSSTGAYNVTDDGAASGTWHTGGGTPADYWIRWTTTVGTLSTGTAGSWLQLNANRSWSRARLSIGSDTVTGTVEIATDAAGTNIIASGSISLIATVN